MRKTIWTVGHSTLDWPVFLGLLTFHRMQTLVDVRTFPGSRRYPQFNQEAMMSALPHAGIRYVWMRELGGRRKPSPTSVNTAWRNDAFRGYADYMDTAAFENALVHLERTADESRTAYMCSEAVWWRCHRGLISDALKVRGWDVVHIGAHGTKEHPYTPAARIENNKLSYRELL